MNYIGSKYSLMDFLETTIEEVTGYKNGDYVFADLFAGTGVVGQTYKSKGCSVIANDIQYYSYVLNKHYIENVPELDTKWLDTLNSLPPMEGFIYLNYCEGSGSGRNAMRSGQSWSGFIQPAKWMTILIFIIWQVW